jgi:hypothetical protein
MRVNLRGRDQVTPRPPAPRKQVPEGHLKVARYEVLGRVFFKPMRPGVDDR